MAATVCCQAQPPRPICTTSDLGQDVESGQTDPKRTNCQKMTKNHYAESSDAIQHPSFDRLKGTAQNPQHVTPIEGRHDQLNAHAIWLLTRSHQQGFSPIAPKKSHAASRQSSGAQSKAPQGARLVTWGATRSCLPEKLERLRPFLWPRDACVILIHPAMHTRGFQATSMSKMGS